jgi:cytochrome oxidase Cu insertion factor (SCO1/SenC/PrrC family)
MLNLTGALNQMSAREAARLQVVFVSLDPDRDTPLTFSGEACVLPLDPNQIIADNYKKKYEIGLSRLKGSLAILLGASMPANDLGRALVLVQQMISNHAANGLAVKARITSRPGKPDANGNVRIFRSDAIIELISAPVTGA